jgi:hypothetical protein
MIEAHPVLRLITTAPASGLAEQLMLRPLLPMIRAFAMEPPLRARTKCRRPPVRRPRAVLAAERAAREGEERRRVLLSTALLDYVPGQPSPQRWPRRHRAGAKPMSMGTSGLTQQEREELAGIEAELGGTRFGPPRTLGDCLPGPCPHVSCRYHLAIDVIQPRVPGHSATVKLNFPGKSPDQMPETCSMRAANAGGATLEVVGQRTNLTEARVEQVEKQALAKVRAYAESHGWDWRDVWAALTSGGS